MAYETKPNTGAIFKNEKKANEKHPDYRGNINVDGKEKEISLWLKESAKGVKYFSVAIGEVWKPKEGSAGTTATLPPNNNFDNSSGLPF